MARSLSTLLGGDARPPRTGVAYIAVRLAVYVVALAAFVLIFGTKERGLFIGPPIALAGGAGTWYLLGDTPAAGPRRLTPAAGVGLLLAQLTWALGYWNVAALVGGAVLWLAFYVLSGVAEHGATRDLDRRIVVEYVVVALLGALVIVGVAHPWNA